MAANARFIGQTLKALVNGSFGAFPKSSILSGALRRNFTVSSCNLLYTKEALGLQNYEFAREKTATQLGTMKDRFKQRMDQYLSADSKSLIFTEDLKNMLYLAEDDKDLELITKMLKKYAKQNEQMRFGSFVFGPVLMRAFHHMNKPELAVASIEDPDLVHVYDQLSSYMLLMDLLYKNERYGDVLKMYKKMTGRPFYENRFPKENLVLAVASCYKLGTPEAYQTAMELVKGAVEKNAPVMRKAISFAAYSAVKANDPAGALELLAIPGNQSYVTVRNLRALALAQMDRLEDVLPILRSVIEQDVGSGKRIGTSFFKDVIEEIKKAVEKKADKELSEEFDKTFKALEQHSNIDALTLAEFLEKPIEDYTKPAPGQAGDFRERRFTNTSRYQPEGGSAPPRQPRYRDDYQQRRFGAADQSRSGGAEKSGYGDSDDHTGVERPRYGGAEGGVDRPRYGSSEGRTGGSYQSGRVGGYGRGEGTRYGVGQRARGGWSDEGRSREGAGDPNWEAGYRPRGQFRQQPGGGMSQSGGGMSQRQGLRDLED